VCGGELHYLPPPQLHKHRRLGKFDSRAEIILRRTKTLKLPRAVAKATLLRVFPESKRYSGRAKWQLSNCGKVAPFMRGLFLVGVLSNWNFLYAFASSVHEHLRFICHFYFCFDIFQPYVAFYGTKKGDVGEIDKNFREILLPF